MINNNMARHNLIDVKYVLTDGVPISSNHPSISNLVSLTPEDSDSLHSTNIVMSSIVHLNMLQQGRQNRGRFFSIGLLEMS